MAPSSRPPPPPYELIQGYRTQKRVSNTHRSPDLDVQLHDLQSHKYEANALAALLIRNTRNPIAHKLPPWEFESLKHQTACYITCPKMLQHYLVRYMAILDKAFFFNAVAKKIRWLGVKDVDERTNAYYMPHFRFIRFTHRQGPESRIRKLEKYIACLVHEMLHAFLEIYTCRCGKCKGNGNFIPLGKTTGHREHFVNALKAIENAMIVELDWVADCNIPLSVMFEMREKGWTPTDDQLREWGVNVLQRSSGKRLETIFSCKTRNK